MSFYDLLEAFPKTGCAICQLLVRDADQFLDALLYEYVNEVSTNAAFRASRGLCNPHGWQLTDYLGNKLGVAILYHAALDELLKITARTTGGITPSLLKRIVGTAPQQLADQLAPTGECPACIYLTEAETRYTRMVSDYLGDERVQKAYQASSGLCLNHFRQTLQATSNKADQEQLIEMQTTIWQALKDEVETFMHKQNVATAEVMGEESDSWRRAIRQLGGERGIFGTRR